MHVQFVHCFVGYWFILSIWYHMCALKWIYILSSNSKVDKFCRKTFKCNRSPAHKRLICFNLERLRNLGSTHDAVAWWPSLTKDMQTEQLLCWSGMTDTEYSATSGSNEENSYEKSRAPREGTVFSLDYTPPPVLLNAEFNRPRVKISDIYFQAQG